MKEELKKIMDNMPKVVKFGGFFLFAFAVLVLVINILFPSFIQRSSIRQKQTYDAADRYEATWPLGAPSAVNSATGNLIAQEKKAPSIVLPPVPPYEEYEGQITAETEKKTIKTGNLFLVVDSSSMAAEKIEIIAKNNGGFILNTNIYKTSETQEEGYVSIKVPFDKFEPSFGQIKKIAKQVKSEATSSSDVTQEYVDLRAQIKNYIAEEDQYREIMKRTVKISDVLEVQKKLSGVRANIDRTQARINYLASQTDMSLIAINLTEVPIVIIPEGQWDIVTTFKKALKELIMTAQSFIDGLIFFVIVTIPSLVPMAFIIWFCYYVVKFFRKKYQNKS